MRSLLLAGLVCLPLACTGAPSAPQQGLSVVRVVTNPQGWGSAVPIASVPYGDGTWMTVLLTADHVVEDSRRVFVELFKPPAYQFADHLIETQIVKRHPNLDLALILIVTQHQVPVLELDYRAPVPGEELIAAGYSWGMFLTLGHGYAGGTYWAFDWPQWEGGYTATSFWLSGCSGGAIISEEGKLLGIVVGGHESEHLGIFLPVVLAENWIEALTEG